MATEQRMIDANALLGDIADIMREMPEPKDHYDNGYYSGLDRAFEIIKQAPTVEAVQGHWKYGTRAAVCSECGFERHLDDNFGAAIACPNCGVKMK